jgi:tetratricopeptide (TPR) repeat protein
MPVKTLRSLSLVMLVLAAVSRADDVKDGMPPRADDLFAEAKALSAREEWQEAIARFRQFLRQHPDDARATEARFWIGFSLVKSEQFGDAVRELEPFEGDLARDKWADDALLQLGHAHRGVGDNDRALASWKLLLEKHPDSVWRIEAAVQSVDLLFHDEKDYTACLTYCERVVRDAAEFAGITEARYAGAYCLNALGRYDEADRWMDRWFTADDAGEAGWRRVLGAQRDLRLGQIDRAFRSLDSLDADFPDLDRGEHIDLTLRTATMLTREKQAGRARDLLVAALRQSAGDSEEDIGALLDQLEETAAGDGAFRDILESLAKEASLPLLARMEVRDRQVGILREEERSEQAESLLRGALAGEKSEYALFRTATLLAELLNEDRDDRTGAMKVLNDVLPRMRRGDLAHQVREAIKGLLFPPVDGRE